MFPVLHKHQLRLVISLIALVEQVLCLHGKQMHTPFWLFWNRQSFTDRLCIRIPIRIPLHVGQKGKKINFFPMMSNM